MTIGSAIAAAFGTSNNTGGAPSVTTPQIVSAAAKVSEIGLSALAFYHQPVDAAIGAALWLGCCDRGYAANKEGAEEKSKDANLETRSDLGRLAINGILGGLILSSGVCHPFTAGVIGFVGTPLIMNTVSDYMK